MKTPRPHISLLLRIVIAVLAGIGSAYILPVWACRIAATFNALFSSLLGFVIPLLILAFVSSAIAGTGRRAGAMLLATVAIAYAMTFGVGMLSYGVSSAVFPSLVGGTAIASVTEAAAAPTPFFTIAFEPPMSVTAALALAFILGFGCAALDARAETMHKALDDFCNIISLIINKLIVPLLPVYIYGIFLNMTLEGTIAPVLVTFVKIIAVIFAMHIGVLVAQYLTASLFSGYNPFKSLWIMLPAYATALGTQSSAATIPVTLERTIAMGVSNRVAGFVIPLCATIHMSGSTMKIVSCAVALMLVRHMPYDAAMFAGFVAMLAISIIAAPGVPGGAIMASLGLLSSMLGFTDADNALMIALYISMDSFGTACNITGDGAIAQIVDSIFRNKNISTSNT